MSMGLEYQLSKYWSFFALDKGKQIEPVLLNAIRDSHFAVVVLTENYADSHWCLKELAKIVECMGDSGRIRTIFYHVDPSDVRNQKGSFEEAMAKHENDQRFSSDEVESWRKALTKVANQSGEPVRKDENKSTLAEAYYNRISHNFDGSSFLPKVREVSKKENGIVELQKQLLADILISDFAIGHVGNGINYIRSRLDAKKVLIVLDDVNKLEQLNALAGNEKWFAKGSIIIVTSREESLLKGRYKIYKAEDLDSTEALELFSWKVFDNTEPPEEYMESSKQVVECANHLPLALIVFGSLLRGKTTREWMSALRRLRECPAKENMEKLKLSFDDLEETDRLIFLDIACFFKGQEENNVKSILDSCGFEPEFGISNLVAKSMLSIQEDRKLWMHDKLQEMGQQISRGNEAEGPSRLWNEEEFNRILLDKTGIEKVEAIVVTFRNEITTLNFEALSNMKRLRLLMILGCFDITKSGTSSTPKLDYLSNNLRLLEWNRFPFKEFPPTFRPDKLVKLKLTMSKLQRLFWNKHIKLPNLKAIDLTQSESFKTIGYFSAVPNLEQLILSDCLQLSEIHSEIDQERSITVLEKLTELNLKNCESLRKLPLASLENLVLSKNPFTVLPPSISGLSHLKFLDLDYCKRLTSLGPELPSSLELVNVNYCYSLKSFLDPLKASTFNCSAVCVECFELVKRQDSVFTASTALDRHFEDDRSRERKFEIVLPGSKLPARFQQSYWKSTRRVTFLRPASGSIRMICLTLAVCLGADSPDGFCCDAKFEMNDGNWKMVTLDCPTNSGSSDHLWITYVPLEFSNSDLENFSGHIEFAFRGKTLAGAGKCWGGVLEFGEVAGEFLERYDSENKELLFFAALLALGIE
ncbi:hypothetical protein FNV43_RR08510 [Rhamnella rubrinervis]|uniref:TIR domain-containing protein n=1 Tax=Rhamnella rubrinervis TaxID=2594499 RepID=A0A8K0H8R4_9ROSA|nr:hypothetical protein FNV43_RR08510 [Rhamnella rubrinervis]